MGSIWGGEQLKMSIFGGESHGPPAVGVVLDGLPAGGEEIDFAKIRSFMARRAPPAASLGQLPGAKTIRFAFYRAFTKGALAARPPFAP